LPSSAPTGEPGLEAEPDLASPVVPARRGRYTRHLHARSSGRVDGLPGVFRRVRGRGAKKERGEPRRYRSLPPLQVWRRGERILGYIERAGVGEVLRAGARKPGVGGQRTVHHELGAGREPGGATRGDRGCIRTLHGKGSHRTSRRGGHRQRPAADRPTVPRPPAAKDARLLARGGISRGTPVGATTPSDARGRRADHGTHPRGRGAYRGEPGRVGTRGASREPRRGAKEHRRGGPRDSTSPRRAQGVRPASRASRRRREKSRPKSGSRR
jgi:hypothetical protein